MLSLRPVSYRVLLLASVAGVALGGAAYAQTGPGPVKTVNGTSPTLNNSGNITGTSGAAVVAGSGAASVANSGLIQATGANGIGVQVVSGGSAGAILANSGTIQTTNASGGTAIQVGDTAGAAFGTITNSGLVQTASGQAVFIAPGSSVTAIVNSGTIQSPNSVAINVAGAVGTISNSGIIQGGTNAVGLRVEGTIGSISNAASGTIDVLGNGNAIYVVGTTGSAGSIGTLANAGMIQTFGSLPAIVLNGSATIGTIVNSAGGIIQSPGNAIDDSGTIGAISNSGTIQTSGNGDSTIIVNGTLGTLTNAGTIQQTTNNATAIHIETGGTAGLISNTAGGLIQAAGTSAAAIRVDGSVAQVLNSAGGTVLAGGLAGATTDGILVAGTVGTINNAGLIQAGNGPAISVDGLDAGVVATIGTIVNTGTIGAQTTGNGILVGNSAASAVGMIANSGLIRSAGSNTAVSVQTFGSVGAIVNSAGGTMFAAGTGHDIFVAGTVGSISNSGTILAPQTSAIDIAAGNSSTVPGLILNGITNTASGLIQGGPSNGSGVAIDDSAGTSKLTIGTAGTIIGAIKLGPAGDTLNITGGSITGAIIGLAGSSDVVNFAPAGTFTTGGSIAGVDTINVNANSVVLQYPVAGAMAFNIAYGATTYLNANVGAVSFNNAGMANIGSGTPTIAGNYTQAATGTLGVTVATPTTAGKLTVTGTATIKGGANAVTVTVPTSVDPFAVVGNTYDILTSGTLLATASALTADSTNPGLAFGLTDSATDLYLNALTQTPAQAEIAANEFLDGLFGPYSSLFNQNDLTMIRFLADLEARLAVAGRIDVAIRLNNVLTYILDDGPVQLVQVLRQVAPSNLNSAALTLGLDESALNSGESNIGNRLTMARLGGTGLAAGDTVGRGITLWGQPFGSLLNENATDGMDGYSIGTYGITIGGDMMVTPEVRAGVAVTLSNSNINFSGYTQGSNATVFNSEFSLYGEWYHQDYFVDGMLSFGYNHFTRHDLVSGLGLSLDSDSGGTQISGKIGGGYDWHVNKLVVTPYVSLQQLHFNFGSYDTSGGAAFAVDQHVGGESLDMTQTQIGARAAYPFALRNGGLLTPEVHAYYLHDFGQNQVSTSFMDIDVPGASTYTYYGTPLDRDVFNIGLSATFAQGPRWSLSGGYDFLGRGSSSANSFYLNVKINF